MEKSKFKLIAGATAFGVTMTSMVTSVLAATDYGTTSRIWGKDRYQTAALIAQNDWSKGSDYAVIARGDDFADGLCAVPFAKEYNAPILLTSKGKLSKETEESLKALKVKKVFIVGGTGAVSEEVEKELKAIVGEVERLGGQDRYGTSVKIASKIGGTSKIAVATGEDFADALSIAAVAANEKMPILLTEKSELPQEVQNYIKDNNIKLSYIVGGTGAVSSEVESKLPGVDRVYGEDRYETNLKIVEKFGNTLNFEKLYLAVGDGPNKDEFADALSGAAAASKAGSPVVLTYNGVKDSVKDYVKSQMTPKSEVVAIGGESVVSEETLKSLVVNAEDFKAYDKKDSTANIKVDGKNVTFENATVKGNVYVYGDGAKLSNVKVEGTVFVDPGENGNATLENVECSKIKVLSGASNSVHLNKTKSAALVVNSKNQNSLVRIVCDKDTKIEAARINSSANIETVQGTDIKVLKISTLKAESDVKLKGYFKEVEVNKEAKLNILDNTKVAVLTLKSEAKVNTTQGSEIAVVDVNEALRTGKVEIDGLGKLNKVISESSSAKVSLGNLLSVGSVLTVNKNSLEAAKAILDKVVEKSNTDILKEAEKAIEDAKKVTPPPVIIPGGGGAYIPVPTETKITYRLGFSHNGKEQAVIEELDKEATVETAYNTLKGSFKSYYDKYKDKEINALKNRAENVYVNETLLKDYISTKLQDKKLSEAVKNSNYEEAADLVSAKLNAKNYDELVQSIVNATNGDVEISSLKYNGKQLEKITIDDVVVYEANKDTKLDSNDLKNLKSKLGITSIKNAKVSSLLGKSIKLQLAGNDVYEISLTRK